MKNFNDFRQDEDGVFLVAIGIVLFLIVGVLALSINMNQIQKGYAKNQGATDSAALAAAEFIMKGKIDKILDKDFEDGDWEKWQPTDEEIKKFALEVFESNLSLEKNDIDITDLAKFEVRFTDNDDTVVVESCIMVQPLSIAASIGHQKEQEVCWESSAAFKVERLILDAEIAFSVDVTSSMAGNGGAKIAGVRDATKYVFDEYVNEDNEDKLLFSFVPFTNYISVSPYQADIVELGDSDFVNEIPFFRQDNLNSNNPNSKWLGQSGFVKLDPVRRDYSTKTVGGDSEGEGAKSVDIYDYYQASLTPFQHIQPLTNDLKLLGDKLQHLHDAVMNNTFGYGGKTYSPSPETGNIIQHHGTSGLTGIIGAWTTLHPGWKGKWNEQSEMEAIQGTSFNRKSLPAADQLPSDNPDRKKYLIHLTDGEDNANDFDTIETSNFDQDYKLVCDAMRAQGIEIFMIFYGTGATSYHEACQPDLEKRFENVPSDKESLRKTYKKIFDIIASEASQVRISK